MWKIAVLNDVQNAAPFDAKIAFYSVMDVKNIAVKYVRRNRIWENAPDVVNRSVKNVPNIVKSVGMHIVKIAVKKT